MSQRRARSPQRRSRRASRGFTLVEILIAATLAALLAAALMEILYGALDLSRQVSQDDAMNRDMLLVVAKFREDIEEADRVLSISPTTLVLIAQNGDTLRYEWSGTSADPLLRQVNGGTKRTVAGRVDNIAFSLQTGSRPFTHERDALVPVATPASKFDEEDVNDWKTSYNCNIEYKLRRVQDDEYSAEQFWNTGDYQGFVGASVHMRAKDHDPPQVDLLVEVYRAGPLPDEYPGTLLAEGVLDRFTMNSNWEWHWVDLTTVLEAPVVAGQTYWLVLRSDGVGGSSYAGHVRYVRMKSCDSYPSNDMCFRWSNDFGATWDGPYIDLEMFFRVYASHDVLKLTEVTEDITDTLGIAYQLSLLDSEGTEERAGFIAMRP
jgi:prepilin-type N-terminal cleavage/methylation domain-containing protein